MIHPLENPRAGFIPWSRYQAAASGLLQFLQRCSDSHQILRLSRGLAPADEIWLEPRERLIVVALNFWIAAIFVFILARGRPD